MSKKRCPWKWTLHHAFQTHLHWRHQNRFDGTYLALEHWSEFKFGPIFGKRRQLRHVWVHVSPGPKFPNFHLGWRFGSGNRISSPPTEEIVATPVRKVAYNRLRVGKLEEMCEIIADAVCKKVEDKKQENSLWTKTRKCVKRAEGLMAILKRSDDWALMNCTVSCR